MSHYRHAKKYIPYPSCCWSPDQHPNLKEIIKVIATAKKNGEIQVLLFLTKLQNARWSGDQQEQRLPDPQP